MLTKLEAVNLMLDAIGESAVNSLSTGTPDAEKAERRLDRVVIDAQLDGWETNTDIRWITPNVNGEFVVPGSALACDTVEHSQHIPVKYRDGKLYDPTNNTFIWTLPKLRVEIIYAKQFEELSYPLRRYIAAKAARVFQEAELGAVQRDSAARLEERDAWIDLITAENEAGDPNRILDNPGSLHHLNRRYRR